MAGSSPSPTRKKSPHKLSVEEVKDKQTIVEVELIDEAGFI
jgi:hypothetical protein